MNVMGKNKPEGSSERPNRTGKAVNVWVKEDLHQALEDFIQAQRVPPKKTDVVELALQEFLKKEGYWPPKSEEE